MRRIHYDYVEKLVFSNSVFFFVASETEVDCAACGELITYLKDRPGAGLALVSGAPRDENGDESFLTLPIIFVPHALSRNRFMDMTVAVSQESPRSHFYIRKAHKAQSTKHD